MWCGDGCKLMKERGRSKKGGGKYGRIDQNVRVGTSVLGGSLTRKLLGRDMGGTVWPKLAGSPGRMAWRTKPEEMQSRLGLPKGGASGGAAVGLGGAEGPRGRRAAETSVPRAGRWEGTGEPWNLPRIWLAKSGGRKKWGRDGVATSDAAGRHKGGVNSVKGRRVPGGPQKMKGDERPDFAEEAQRKPSMCTVVREKVGEDIGTEQLAW